jgi:competence protein ComEA
MRPPQLSEVWRQAGGPKPEPEGTTALESGNRVEISREGNWQVMQMDGERLIIMGLPIDINRASSRDLEALPGVGPTLAGRIIKHRQEFGPFKTIDDLEQVSGLGPKKLDQIKAYIIAKE